MKKIAFFTLLFFPAVSLFSQHYKNNVDTIVTHYSDFTYYKVINKNNINEKVKHQKTKPILHGRK